MINQDNYKSLDALTLQLIFGNFQPHLIDTNRNKLGYQIQMIRHGYFSESIQLSYETLKGHHQDNRILIMATYFLIYLMKDKKHTQILWDQIKAKNLPCKGKPLCTHTHKRRYCAQYLEWTAVHFTSEGGKLKQKSPN